MSEPSAGARDAELGDLILRACLIRRSVLIGLGVGVRIVGSRYSADARRLRDPIPEDPSAAHR
jgi:thioredoxin reductase (NADPH)